MKAILAIIILIGMAGCRSTSDLKVVSGFEAQRYMGTWYEVARLPHRFEKGMSSVSAEYRMNDNGTIRVINKGYVNNTAEWKDIEGIAKFKGRKDNGWLKVSFFRPFYASYKVIHLNDDYTEAIVTGPSYGYLWILSRSPGLPEGRLDDLISKARSMGFDTDRLIVVDQSENES